ncbi:hypothetical protein BGZ94_002404 [Podila epigama]|nr:hypothetical protein BGZ94_002404 [Podila epigama]
MEDDNKAILERAADSCRTLDDIRCRLYTIQKQLAKHRIESDHSFQDASTRAGKSKAMTALLHEAYTLQFQIATLLSSTEEPIPERQRRRPRQTAATSISTNTTTLPAEGQQQPQTISTTHTDNNSTSNKADAESIPESMVQPAQATIVATQQTSDTAETSTKDTPLVV